MNRRITTSCNPWLLLLVASCTLTAACGGGGGGGGGGVIIPPGVTSVTFTPAAGGDVAMDTGGTATPSFSIDVNVDAIDDLFGAAFHVTFDPSTASFLGVSGAGSILSATGAQTQFSASTLQAGELAVVATIVGPGFCSSNGAMCSTSATCPIGATCLGGINNADGRLVRLSFMATQITPGNTFAFPASGRNVSVCPTAGGACSEISSGLTFTGGTMVAN